MSSVREVLVSEYGPEWVRRLSGVASVATRSWYEYVTRPGQSYPDMVWDSAECVVLNYTVGRDVHGYEDAIGVSNYRVLMDQWSDVDGLTSGPYSGQSCVSLDLDSPAPEDLVDVLDALESYPILDESDYSDAEQEIIAEHWESYGRSDVFDAVARALGADGRSDLTEYAERTVEMLVWSGRIDYGCGGGYPSVIDVSACDFGEKEISAWIAERVGSGSVVTLGPRWSGDDVLNLRMSRADWIRPA